MSSNHLHLPVPQGDETILMSFKWWGKMLQTYPTKRYTYIIYISQVIQKVYISGDYGMLIFLGGHVHILRTFLESEGSFFERMMTTLCVWGQIEVIKGGWKQKLYWLVVSTHLKNISQNEKSSPNRCENTKYLKPPPREVIGRVNSPQLLIYFRPSIGLP